MTRLAILAGSGGLPVRLAACRTDALQICFTGVSHELGAQAREHSFEKLGTLFETLHAQGVTEVVMAGAMSRPPLDPKSFDPVMLALAPRLISAMQGGDDALLRFVIQVFEEQGFSVRGAHEIDPRLTAEVGVLVGQAPGEKVRADSERAIEILSALGPLDVGQGAVVENGLCLGIETIQGTDALLGFVSQTAGHLRKGGGVFVKAPKHGQDLRVDMPTIGPDTIRAVAQARLSTLVIAAGGVIVIERAEVCQLAGTLGVSVIAQGI